MLHGRLEAVGAGPDRPPPASGLQPADSETPRSALRTRHSLVAWSAGPSYSLFCLTLSLQNKETFDEAPYESP